MKMSTYLVAFVVGPFEQTARDRRRRRRRCASSTRPARGTSRDFALEIGAFSLRFFSDYFDIAVPGDKVDLVAIPDFSAGAMENLGCITFRETALLVDPATASQLEIQRVAEVVAHELAHMWFGDLVTMQWWEGIWLNEAFATFMESLCTEDVPARVAAAGSRFGIDARRRRSPSTGCTRRGRSSTRCVSPDEADGDVRRPHLREGRRGAAHARAVPRRGRLPRRHPPLPARPRVREHRDQPTSGTRSRRRPASRSARSWTPGSSRAATRVVDRRRRHDRARSRSAHAEDRGGSDRLVVARAGALATARRGRRRRASCWARSPSRSRRPAPRIVERRRIGIYRTSYGNAGARERSRAPSTSSRGSSAPCSSNDTWALVLAGRREVRRHADARAWARRRGGARRRGRPSPRRSTTSSRAAATPADRPRSRGPSARCSGRSSRQSAGSRSPARTSAR